MLAAGGMTVMHEPGRDRALACNPRAGSYDVQPGSFYETSAHVWRSPKTLAGMRGTVLKRLGRDLHRTLPTIDGVTYRVVVMTRDPRASDASMRRAFGHERRVTVERYWPQTLRVAAGLPQRGDVEDVLMFWYPSVVARPGPHLELMTRRGWPIGDMSAAARVPDDRWFRHRMPWEMR